jgi:hypothetical protein
MTTRELLFLLLVWPAFAWWIVFTSPHWTPVVLALLTQK